MEGERKEEREMLKKNERKELERERVIERVGCRQGEKYRYRER